MPESQLPFRIELRVGDETEIVLPNSGVTGYVWQTDIGSDSHLAEVGIRRGVLPATSPPKVGVASPEVLSIHALAQGEVTIRLAQRRPWEKDVEPVQSHEISLSIRD